MSIQPRFTLIPLVAIGLALATAPASGSGSARGTEGAAEHQALRLQALIAQVGTEGAAEHAALRDAARRLARA
jgi:hypothetical protein